MRANLLLAIALLLGVAHYSAQPSLAVYLFGNNSGNSRNNNSKSIHNNIEDKISIKNAASHSDLTNIPSANRLSPLILLPGDGGSRLEAKLDRKNVAHHYCERKSDDWFDLWVNLSLLVPFALDCWVDNMKLVYNATTRRSSNAPGVTTRVNGFARTEAVEYVDPARVYGTNYFDALVRQMVEFGYERDKNIFGAPYDFRRAPSELEDYFENLERLVVTAYEKNAGERVVFVCHSMGCPYGFYFLNSKPQTWKDKYIRSVVSLAGVYAGSVKAMKAYASGDNFGIVVLPSLSVRKDVRTFSSLPILLPSPEVWPKDKVLLRNRNVTYTVNDYKRFFHDIDFPTGYEMWLDVKDLVSPLKAPGVEVHCLHGQGVSTPEYLDYQTGQFPDSKPIIKYGDGDGTVNLLSLRSCLGWVDKQRERVHYKNFSSVDHMTILSDGKVMAYIGEALAKV